MALSIYGFISVLLVKPRHLIDETRYSHVNGNYIGPPYLFPTFDIKRVPKKWFRIPPGGHLEVFSSLSKSPKYVGFRG